MRGKPEPVVSAPQLSANCKWGHYMFKSDESRAVRAHVECPGSVVRRDPPESRVACLCQCHHTEGAK